MSSLILMYALHGTYRYSYVIATQLWLKYNFVIFCILTDILINYLFVCRVGMLVDTAREV